MSNSLERVLTQFDPPLQGAFVFNLDLCPGMCCVRVCAQLCSCPAIRACPSVGRVRGCLSLESDQNRGITVAGWGRICG